jgi:hypothetical protein
MDRECVLSEVGTEHFYIYKDFILQTVDVGAGVIWVRLLHWQLQIEGQQACSTGTREIQMKTLKVR